MRAKFVEVPHGRLRRISTRIVSEVPEVSRVLYDITDKPPATIEFE
jgi:GMP synthase (glutamine-hydrolysing)